MPDTRGMSYEQFRNLSVEALLELELIPIIARVQLPEEIGATKSSCVQAELRALKPRRGRPQTSQKSLSWIRQAYV